MATVYNIYIGQNRILTNGPDIADEYKCLAIKDERAALILYNQSFYEQSAYLIIQSMEKYIKAHISSIIDITNPYYASKIRDIGHSLDSAIDFLLEIVTAGKDIHLAGQLEYQLKDVVFKNIRFGSLNSSLRYPMYNYYKNGYSIKQLSKQDCVLLFNMLNQLKEYLNQILLVM